MTNETKFNLSEKEEINEYGISLYPKEDVKEFIKRQIDRIDLKLENLEHKLEHSGRLESAYSTEEITVLILELRKVKDDLLKDAGDKLTNGN